MNTELYIAYLQEKEPDLVEHWLAYNQADFSHYYDDMQMINMPDYDTTDYIE